VVKIGKSGDNKGRSLEAGHYKPVMKKVIRADSTTVFASLSTSDPMVRLGMLDLLQQFKMRNILSIN
jgi:hypothetical protein